MGRATEMLQLPTQVVVERAARRRKFAFAAIGMIAVTAAVGAGAAVFVLDSGKAVTLHKEWATFQGCMLGDPLEANERPSSRFRLLHLAKLGKPEDKAADPTKVWPSTCLGSLGSVVDTSSHVSTGGDDLNKAASAVGKAVSTNTLTATPKLLDDLWKAAAAAKLNDPPGPRPETTPKAVTTLFGKGTYEAQPRPLGDFALGSVRIETSLSTTPRFLVDDRTAPKGPTVCESEAGSISRVNCTTLPSDIAKLAPGLRLLGSTETGAAALVFAGERGTGGVFRELSAPAVVQGVPVFGGSSKAQKRARIVAKRPTGLVLIDTAGKDGPPVETRLRDLADTALAGDWIFTRERDVLTAQRVGENKRIEVGPFPEAFSTKADDRVTYCRAGSTEVVRIRGTENDFVMLGTEDAWSSPKKLRFADHLSCAEGVALLTTIANNDPTGHVHATVRVSRCSSTECKDTQLSHYDMLSGNADLLPPTRSELAVTTAAGRVYFAWFTSLGDLRVRSGAVDTVAATPDVVLHAPLGEAEVSVHEVALVPSTTGALLLARTSDGVRLFGLAQDGTVTPVVTTAP